MRTAIADAGSSRTGEWVPRLARTLGGLVGAVLISTLLVSYVVGGSTPWAAIPRSTSSLAATALAFVVGLPAGFALVLALGWRESRPSWPTAGFLLGSALVAGVFISTWYSSDAGMPPPGFPFRLWWACVLMPVLGALAAYVVLLRRAST